MSLNNVLNVIEHPNAAGDNVYNLGGTVNIDVITEFTAGAGVTIDSVLLKDGAVTTTGINVVSATDAITAFATGGQGSAVALTKELNSITVCATAGDSVKLPLATVGKTVTVNNLGAKYADVFPFASDLIDASAINAAIPLAPGQSITFTCTVLLKWKSSPQEKLGVQYTTGTTTTTFAVDQLTGAAYVVYNNTQGTPGSIAVRTAALMIADDPFFRIGGAYRLRIINNQGTGTLTVTTAAGVTLTGTMTIAVNTFRDFAVTYNSATTMTIQSMGIGTDD